MKNLRSILLAEDDPNDVELTLTALSEHRLTNNVDVVSNGAEALDYLRCQDKYAQRAGGNPAVVLLDMKMPLVDGLQVLREMKRDDALKLIPVVMLTSSREERDVLVSYELGVNAYVIKPVSFPDFMDALKTLGCFWAIVNHPPRQVATDSDK